MSARSRSWRRRCISPLVSLCITGRMYWVCKLVKPKIPNFGLPYSIDWKTESWRTFYRMYGQFDRLWYRYPRYIPQNKNSKLNHPSQLRNSGKYVSYKDLKSIIANLKIVYAAIDAIDTFGEHQDKKYPKIAQSQRNNWANLRTYFKYLQEMCKLIYTTKAIKGFNLQLSKVTKEKSVSPTNDRLLKILYLAIMDIIKK